MNVYTAGIKIQLNTPLSNVCLPNCLRKMFWTGLTKLISANNSEIQLHHLIYAPHYIYLSKLNSLAISIQDFISKLLIKYDLENFPL